MKLLQILAGIGQFLAAAVSIVLMLAIQLFMFGAAICLGVWLFLKVISLF